MGKFKEMCSCDHFECDKLRKVINLSLNIYLYLYCNYFFISPTAHFWETSGKLGSVKHNHV